MTNHQPGRPAKGRICWRRVWALALLMINALLAATGWAFDLPGFTGPLLLTELLIAGSVLLFAD